MIKRRKARELALQILFQADVGNLPIEEAMETTLAEATDMDEEIRNYAAQLVRGVWGQRDKLDKQIQSVATNWTIERMAAIDRNLIRMALYEILYVPDVPYRVAINEAVELAKEYGTTESRRFVNGVLGALVRKMQLKDKQKEQKG
ncbi:NusB antitermination factor [Candidatus Fervidibacteria bacterium JGI MDM2 JNZ-1-D12]